MSGVGDREHLPFASEPVLWLHPAEAGGGRPGAVDPGGRDQPALEDEPVLWLRPSGAPVLLVEDAPSPAGREGPPEPTPRQLPATGAGLGWRLMVPLVALGWLLRRRGPAQGR